MQSKFRTPLSIVIAISCTWGFILLVEGANRSVNTLSDAAQRIEWNAE